MCCCKNRAGGTRLNSPTTRTSTILFDEPANALSAITLDLATRLIRAEQTPEWQSAFSQSGLGSCYARAAIISERIYELAAPIPDGTPSPDRNSLLHEVAVAVTSVREEVGAGCL
jgi:hypothetical protein